MRAHKLDQLTPKERVYKAISLKIPDRVPVIPQIMYTASRIAGIKFSEAMKDPMKMKDALLKSYREVGYDGVYVGWESSFNLMAEAMGCRLRYGEDSIPTVSQTIVSKKEDVGNLKIPDPWKDGRMPIYLEATRLVKSELQDVAPILGYVPGPLTLSSVLRGPGAFLLDLVRNRDMVEELADTSTQASTAFAEAKISEGADIIVIAEPMSSTSVISPKMFREIALPRIRNILATIQSRGATPSLHICGNTTPILSDIAEIGTKIFEVDHLVDLAIAKRALSGKVCVQGNVNPTGTLNGTDPMAVITECRECIAKAAEGGGYILSSGCEVPLDAPLENLKAMVRAAVDHG